MIAMNTRTLEIELLRTFVAVVDHGGFTRAAERLFLTQSTISAQIRRLEEQVGHALLARSTRSMALTAPGEMLLGHARAMLQLDEEARAGLAGSTFSGRIRIGASEDFADSWLPFILRRFGTQHPGVQLTVELGLGPKLFKVLQAGRLELVIGSECRGRTRGRLLWKEPLVWAAAEDVPSALASSDELPLALFSEPCPYRDAALAALERQRRKWRVACLGSSVAGVRIAALAGLAVTPLPRSALGSGLRDVGVAGGLPALPDVKFLVAFDERGAAAPVRELAELIIRSAGRELGSALRPPSIEAPVLQGR
jgi:DNA-binding transcriptional LysR family regulator